jgi:hypothetical protein
MATSIDNVFKRLKYKASKFGYVGTITSTDFNLLFPANESKYFLKLFGNQNKYQVANMLPSIAYPGTLKVSTSLSPFKKITTLTIDGTGQAPKPTDMYFIDSLSHTTSFASSPIKRVEIEQLANYLSSYIDYPTTLFPIYVEYGTYIQFYPITLGTANLSYLKAPGQSVWNYSLNGTIATTNTLVGGVTYVNGIYTNVPLTGGSGTGAMATITVSSTNVTSVIITNGGFTYKTGDTLSCSNTYLGGSGTGFSIKVATLINTRQVYTSTGSTDPLWNDFDIDEIIYMTLQDIGISLRDGETEQFATINSKEGGIA